MNKTLKKLTILFVALFAVLSFSACGNKSTGSSEAGKEVYQSVKYDVNDSASILSAIEKAFDDAEKSINDQSSSVLDKIGNSYDSYTKNSGEVTAFYNATKASADALYTDIEEMAINYFKCVAVAGLDDFDAWDDAMEGFYKVWDRGMGDFYDTFDDGYEKIYKKCDSIIDDAPDSLEYSEISDTWSAMYEEYSDAWSEMYQNYSDKWSDIYGKYSAMWSGFYSGSIDVDAILKEYELSQDKDDEADTDESSAAESNHTTDNDTESTEFDPNAQPVDDTEYENDGFVYRIYTDDTIEIVGYKGSKASLSISSTIDGHDVSRIGKRAFENCTAIENITMWPHVISIGEEAFKGCVSLEEFSIPSTVTVINDSVFEDCTNLETIIIWGDVTTIGKAAFKNCTSLEEVSIPKSTRLVGEAAFEGCSSLESVIFWGGKEIGDYAFRNCTRLEEISIPREITKVGISAFEGCTSLESVIVWGDNVAFGVNAFANCPKLDEMPKGATIDASKLTTANPPNDTGSSDTNSASKKGEKNDGLVDGMRPEFKEAMDRYEDFYNQYCDCMEKYSDNPSDLELLAEYTKLLSKEAEVRKAFEKWDEDEMNDAELSYYIDVNARIQKRLLAVSAG